MPSIAEVARLAGVSIATASRVVGDSSYPVSPLTRERVLDAARELDYVPNALARGLRAPVPLVGVIVHDITDPYFSEVVRGVEDGAAAGGYLVVTGSSDRDPERENSYVRLLRSMRASLVVFAGSGIDNPDLNAEVARHLMAIRAHGGQVVHLSPHAQGAPEVGVDNAAGICSMIGALAALGHRRIAFLAGAMSLYVARERLAGYQRGLNEAGIVADQRLIVHGTFDQAGGGRGVDQLLASGAPFTAICCANDLLALGVLRRLEERGIRVPGDVSVAGVDDISTATMVSPSLSTVRLPLRELGRRGFEFGLAALNGEQPEPVTLPIEVVLRDSTAPPRGTP
jgi:LacI family transcriptional regulator